MGGRLIAQTRGSKFVKYQELRVQELPTHVPVGHVPRSITAHCRGELTRQCAPGDTVTLCGIFLPQRFTGFQGMRAGLVSDTFLEAMLVDKEKKNYRKKTINKNRAPKGVDLRSFYALSMAEWVMNGCS